MTYVINRDYNFGGDFLNDIKDIALKLCAMSISNIKWSCLYSGAGIIHTPAQLTDSDSSRSSDKKSSSQLKDVAMLKCIYCKAKPVFTKPPEEISNPGKYMWNFKSFSKSALPSVQALAILSMCKTCEVMYKEELSTCLALLEEAKLCCGFASKYMRNDDGFFIAVEDKTKNIDEEPTLKMSSKNFKLCDQVLMHEAFLYVAHLMSMDEYPEYKSDDAERYLSEAERISSFMLDSDNYDMYVDMSSRDLSTCISSLSRSISSQPSPLMQQEYKIMISKLCAELDSRIRITGEVDKSFSDFSSASIMTHFRTCASLYEGYLATDIYKFKDLGDKVYEYLEDLYDPGIKLYLKGDAKKLSYTIKDVADILNLQQLRYRVSGDDKVLSRFKDIYKTSIENTLIMQSVPSKSFSLGSTKISFPKSIPSSTDSGKAPVFMKSFKISFKKDACISVSKHYNSLYALYSSFSFLHYLLPFVNENKASEAK